MTKPSPYTDYKAVVIDGPDKTRRIRLFPPADPRLLVRLAKAAEMPRGAARTRDLRKAVLAAHGGGHSVATMTRSAPVSRQTIYGILHAAKSQP